MAAANSAEIVSFAAGLAAGLATLAGGALAFRLASRIHLVLGFSAGAVVGVALLDLLPEAVNLGGHGVGPGRVTVFVAVGYALYLLADRALSIRTRGGGAHRGHFGAGSLTAHSLMDGLGIGLGFQASPAIGVALAAAVLAHDLADGMNTVNVSLSGANSARATRRWLIADAIAPVAGVALSQVLAPPPTALGPLVAVFTGFFLYIGASELVPASHRSHPRAWTAVATVLGMALIWAVTRVAA